jgi:hypothetical protein
MVRGLNGFKEWFQGYERYYAIIGGTACELLINEAGGEFRATRDIDMVLLVETLDASFGERFWGYIRAGGYEHRQAGTENPQYYRFTKPASADYPHMIELFSRKVEGMPRPTDALLTPLPFDEDVSSLSAILLDDDYYDFLKTGIRIIDGLPVLGAECLIPFKAKAWLDLTERKANGGQVDSRHIRKHKNDVFALSGLLQRDTRIDLPKSIQKDFADFIAANSEDFEKLRRIAEIYGVAG